MMKAVSAPTHQAGSRSMSLTRRLDAQPHAWLTLMKITRSCQNGWRMNAKSSFGVAEPRNAAQTSSTPKKMTYRSETKLETMCSEGGACMPNAPATKRPRPLRNNQNQYTTTTSSSWGAGGVGGWRSLLGQPSWRTLLGVQPLSSGFQPGGALIRPPGLKRDEDMRELVFGLRLSLVLVFPSKSAG